VGTPASKSQKKNLKSSGGLKNFENRVNSIKYSGVIKEDLLALFHEFHKETLDLFSLNFGIITLIPKIGNATKIQQIDLFVSSTLVSRFLQNLELTG
jgi:hypothetical protein